MKFKYDDKVKVINGFYREQVGTIKQHWVEKSWFKESKQCYMFVTDKITVYITENDLELVKE